MADHTTEHAGECDECGEPLAGMIVDPWGDMDIPVLCPHCHDDGTVAYVKPLRRTEERWHAGGETFESMRP